MSTLIMDAENADIFIRVRPENRKERNYRPKGDEKHLADFDHDSVTIGGRKGKQSTKLFTYPRVVLGPNCTQDETYVKMGIDGILDKFLFENEDACILAYGQTGIINVKHIMWTFTKKKITFFFSFFR